MDGEKLYVIIAAAGMGKRMGLGYNKNYTLLCGLPVLVRTLEEVAQIPGVGGAVVTVAPGEEERAESLLHRYQQYYAGLSWKVAAGGKERQDSVALGCAVLPPEAKWVAVHDGARPFAAPELFSRVWEAARRNGAAVAAVPVKDTVKEGDGQHRVVRTLQRSRLWAVQTPQIFSAETLRQACRCAQQQHLAVTDDASILEYMGLPVELVEGSYSNRKLTTPDDLLWARAMLGKKEEKTMEFRVGTGYDVHRLVEGRPLILCGVHVPCALGLLGHSDADAALHALMDALLGAAGMGDIGKLFPDNDDRFLGADSRQLLRIVLQKIKAAGWQVNNVDVTIIAQKPKLAPWEPAMKQNLMADLELAEDAVNVKATTTEKLGFTGRGEGIAAEAAASLCRGNK